MTFRLLKLMPLVEVEPPCASPSAMLWPTDSDVETKSTGATAKPDEAAQVGKEA